MLHEEKSNSIYKLKYKNTAFSIISRDEDPNLRIQSFYKSTWVFPQN